ncbi:branched-chain amino acid transport system substrate-binding protein [Nakamurella sp. UYEF19]|uniref:ABC transporter substrate-binding protein n=1 Tax=Nakamurella sp. UYEF19 TaxID=1756392 RepID=UPI00339B7F15
MEQNVPTDGPRLNRRRFLQAGGLGLSTLALSGPLLAACSGSALGDSTGGAGSSAPSAGSSAGQASQGSGAVTSARSLKVGFVSPITGPAAGFGEPDSYVLSLARRAFADGLTVGGKKYAVQVIDKDGQSNPQRGSQVANDLITSEGVDLMLTTSTPETVNPVSDACEAAGVPCISTVVPWEAWYYGRGAKPDQKAAYKFTYHFCFGVQQFYLAYSHLWPQVSTNKKVAVMWPNDSDGNAIRAALGPLLAKDGYTIVDPGAYTDGTNDYSAQIAKFKAEKCEIMSTFPIPSDFATFWQQAAQQGFRPKIAQAAKTGLFPSQVEALGGLGVDLAGAAYWTPTYPYASSLTKVGSKELADGYESASGKQWTQQLGATLALFDAGAAALQKASDPTDRNAVAAAIGTLDVQTPVGRLQWGNGPVANVVATPIIGGQWVKAASGSKHPLEFVLCENSADPKVPVAAKLQPFGA